MCWPWGCSSSFLSSLGMGPKLGPVATCPKCWCHWVWPMGGARGRLEGFSPSVSRKLSDSNRHRGSLSPAPGCRTATPSLGPAGLRVGRLPAGSTSAPPAGLLSPFIPARSAPCTKSRSASTLQAPASSWTATQPPDEDPVVPASECSPVLSPDFRSSHTFLVPLQFSERGDAFPLGLPTAVPFPGAQGVSWPLSLSWPPRCSLAEVQIESLLLRAWVSPWPPPQQGLHPRACILLPRSHTPAPACSSQACAPPRLGITPLPLPGHSNVCPSLVATSTRTQLRCFRQRKLALPPQPGHPADDRRPSSQWAHGSVGLGPVWLCTTEPWRWALGTRASGYLP